MGQPYVGEIRMFGGNFEPAGWKFCEGQLLPISEFETLFNLIGTTYGGDGQSTFALPDLRGRVPIHMGSGSIIGQLGGVETVTLTMNQIPSHSHVLLATTTGSVLSPSGALPALASGGVSGLQTYGPTPANTNLNPNSIQNAGGSQPHSNFQPYLCVSFIISLFGIFPSQT